MLLVVSVGKIIESLFNFFANIVIINRLILYVFKNKRMILRYFNQQIVDLRDKSLQFNLLFFLIKFFVTILVTAIDGHMRTLWYILNSWMISQVILDFTVEILNFIFFGESLNFCFVYLMRVLNFKLSLV